MLLIRRHTILLTASGLLVFGLLVGIFFLAAKRNVDAPDTNRLSAVPQGAETSDSRSLEVVPMVGSEGISETQAPLTDSVRTFIANFYAGYQEADSTRLTLAFSIDATAEDLNQRLTLFSGKDSNGKTAGPQLFVDAAANQKVTSYKLIDAVANGNSWRLSVEEERVSLPKQLTVGTRSVILTLIPAPTGTGTWLIESYTYKGGAGKYTAFLNK